LNGDICKASAAQKVLSGIQAVRMGFDRQFVGSFGSNPAFESLQLVIV
jgi:hypothetical protein